jgi:hypothetical protein
LVATLTNTASDGTAIASGTPQINFALLNTDVVAVAIANGANGVPYTVPTPSSQDGLAPTPTHVASVTVRAIDTDGQPLTNAAVIYLNDPVSPVQITAASSPANVVFQPVPPGVWTATVIDTTTGRRASVTLNPALLDGTTRQMTVAMPYRSTSKLLGAYNLALSANPIFGAYGFNGDPVHPSLAYLNTPRALMVNSGALKFVDLGNGRIRSLVLGDPNALVNTVAGNGRAFSGPAGEGAAASGVPVGITAATTFSTDSTGSLIFSEPLANRISRVANGTGALTTYLNPSGIASPAWAPGLAPGPIAVAADPISSDSMLFIGSTSTTGPLSQVDMTLYQGGQPLSATGVVTPIATDCDGGGLLRAGKYLFYSAAREGTYELIRRDLTSTAEVIVAGATQAEGGAIYTYADALAGQTVPAFQFYQSNPHASLSMDNNQNLYFTSYNPAPPNTSYVFRVTNALGPDVSQCLLSYLGVNGPNVAANPAGGLLYLSGLFPVPDPTSNAPGAITNVHSITQVGL